MDNFKTVITENKLDLYFLNSYNFTSLDAYKEKLEEITSEEKFTGQIVIDNTDYYATFLDGYFHSFNGEPALYMFDVFENKGYSIRMWMEGGSLHREDGPALINERTQHKEFYLSGLKLPLHHFIQVASLTDEQKLDLVLKYG